MNQKTRTLLLCAVLVIALVSVFLWNRYGTSP